MSREHSSERPAQETEKISDNERIASREDHEVSLKDIISSLTSDGYFREGESAKLVFAQPGSLGGGHWGKKDGSWRENMGRAVAICETVALSNPPVDLERSKKFGRQDHVETQLLAAGYLIGIWADYEEIADGSFKVDYYIYESSSK